MDSQKINPVQAWQLCTSVKLYFEDKYDAPKYNFRMPSLTASGLLGRKDRYFFEKLARNHSEFDECLWFVVSNVLAGNGWIGDMNEQTFTEFSAWHQSMAYRFEQELKSVMNRFGCLDDALEAQINLRDTRPPPILFAYTQKDISIHTIAILQCFTSFLDREMRNVPDPLGMWNDHCGKIVKYAKILHPRIPCGLFSKMKNTTIKLFTPPENLV